MKQLLLLITSLALFLGTMLDSRAIVIQGATDSSYNTAEPSGPFQDSGWEYQGNWGAFLGTAVSSNYFITAKHVGGAINDSFTYQGVAYTATDYVDHPESSVDLRLWKVAGNFPSWATICAHWQHHREVAIAFGRGSIKGTAVTNTVSPPYITFSEQRGWQHASGGGHKRWGQSYIVSGGSDPEWFSVTDFWGFHMYYENDPILLNTNEFSLALGDSGGGLFVRDRFKWRLRGIAIGNEYSEFRLTESGSNFFASVTNAAGLYDHTGLLYTDEDQFPWVSKSIFADTTKYAGWIHSIIGGIALTSPKWNSSGHFEFQVSGDINNKHILVEYSTNGQSWSTLQSLTNSGITYTATDLNATNSLSRLYRAQVVNGPKSETAVGFYNVHITNESVSESRTWLQALHLEPESNRLLHGVLGAPPVGTEVAKWDGEAEELVYSTALSNTGWTSRLEFYPGDGYYITLPPNTSHSYSVVGFVPENGIQVCPGWNLMGAPGPMGVALLSADGWSPEEFDEALYISSGGFWVGTQYLDGDWLDAISLDLGQGVWYYSDASISKPWHCPILIW